MLCMAQHNRLDEPLSSCVSCPACMNPQPLLPLHPLTSLPSFPHTLLFLWAPDPCPTPYFTCVCCPFWSSLSLCLYPPMNFWCRGSLPWFPELLTVSSAASSSAPPLSSPPLASLTTPLTPPSLPPQPRVSSRRQARPTALAVTFSVLLVSFPCPRIPHQPHLPSPLQASVFGANIGAGAKFTIDSCSSTQSVYISALASKTDKPPLALPPTFPPLTNESLAFLKARGRDSFQASRGLLFWWHFRRVSGSGFWGLGS